MTHGRIANGTPAFSDGVQSNRAGSGNKSQLRNISAARQPLTRVSRFTELMPQAVAVEITVRHVYNGHALAGQIRGIEPSVVDGFNQGVWPFATLFSSPGNTDESIQHAAG